LKHSIALVTGDPSGLGHPAARLLAQAALADLVERGRPIDFLLLNLNAGLVPTKARVIAAAAVEEAQALQKGHYQLNVGLLHSPKN
jgi:NADP-dependent 3-hydroxy acid dehydrogenase YdfG